MNREMQEDNINIERDIPLILFYAITYYVCIFILYSFLIPIYRPIMSILVHILIKHSHGEIFISLPALVLVK